jgi:hypothetical protein
MRLTPNSARHENKFSEPEFGPPFRRSKTVDQQKKSEPSSDETAGNRRQPTKGHRDRRLARGAKNARLRLARQSCRSAVPAISAAGGAHLCPFRRNEDLAVLTGGERPAKWFCAALHAAATSEESVPKATSLCSERHSEDRTRQSTTTRSPGPRHTHRSRVMFKERSEFRWSEERT